MELQEIKTQKKECLDKLYQAIDIQEKLKWQNVYFWWIRNEDRLKTNKLI